MAIREQPDFQPNPLSAATECPAFIIGAPLAAFARVGWPFYLAAAFLLPLEAKKKAAGKNSRPVSGGSAATALSPTKLFQSCLTAPQVGRLKVKVFRCAGACRSAQQGVYPAQEFQQALLARSQVRMRKHGFRLAIRSRAIRILVRGALNVRRPAAQSRSRNLRRRLLRLSLREEPVRGRDHFNPAASWGGDAVGLRHRLYGLGKQAVWCDLAAAACNELFAIVEHVEAGIQVAASECPSTAIVDDAHGRIRSSGNIIGIIGDKVNAVVTNVLGQSAS